VPVITLAGKSHRSRVGVSILTGVGSTELIASTFEEYIKGAVTLGAHVTRRCQISSALRDQMMNSQLMKVAGFVDELEAAYQQIWRVVCSAEGKLR